MQHKLAITSALLVVVNLAGLGRILTDSRSLKEAVARISVDRLVAVQNEQRAELAAAQVLTSDVAVGLPVRIRIPSIDVDAVIEEVAVEQDGSMGVPQEPMSAGWYAPGPRPGEVGSAAIAGHVDWLNGAKAVFKNLHKVRSGDLISVLDDDGQETAFRVREVRRYESDDDATDVFASGDGQAHLNIITCDGEWDETVGQYAQRLVVFTDREPGIR